MLLSSGRWDPAFVNTVWVDKVPGGKMDSLAIDMVLGGKVDFFAIDKVLGGKVDFFAINMVLGGKVDSVATASSEVVECLGRVPEKSELILPREFV